jgi:hypothetical protein
MAFITHIINSRDCVPLDATYPNAYFRVEIPTVQNVQNINMTYTRIDGRINNINVNTSYIWAYYPDATHEDDKWQIATAEEGCFDDPQALAGQLSTALNNATPAGSVLKYYVEYAQTSERFHFYETHNNINDRRLSFEDSPLQEMLGYKHNSAEITGNQSQGWWADSSSDVWACYKEIYLLSGSGQNVNWEMLWPTQANPKHVLAVLPLIWQTKDSQDSQFFFTAQTLAYMTPPIFETPNSLKNLDFQFIYRTRNGFFLLPQKGSAGNTIILQYSIL